nr:hypothetical protein [Tanacetum cinerariifolium]
MISQQLDAFCTPESFVTHSNVDTPDRTVYYILELSSNVLLVKGNVYDSVNDYVVAYMKYAVEAGFVVRRSCQKGLRNGDVKQKYLVCNRKGCPEDDSCVIGSFKEVTIYEASLSSTMIEDGDGVSSLSRVFVAELFDTSEFRPGPKLLHSEAIDFHCQFGSSTFEPLNFVELD